MYQIIYNFLTEYIFNGAQINEAHCTFFDTQLSVSSYLATATTIVVLFGLLFFAYWIIKALFKLTSGLFKW